MAELFLILHKVRGEPAFDIAINDPDFKDRWIRPADDRRVFPIQTWPLAEMGYINVWPSCIDQDPEWHDWPDCAYHETWPDYNPKSIRNTAAGAVLDILSTLGISEKPIKRRSL